MFSSINLKQQKSYRPTDTSSFELWYKGRGLALF